MTGSAPRLRACLGAIPEGRILSDGELEQLHTLFVDRYFGELIFLVDEGVLIVPSHMGERPIRAMHGYHPAEKAQLCRSWPPTAPRSPRMSTLFQTSFGS